MKSINKQYILLVIVFSVFACHLGAQDYETVRSIELTSSPAHSYYINDYGILHPGVRISATAGVFFIRSNPTPSGRLQGGLNYVRTEAYRKAISDDQLIESLPPEERALSYKYIDGLGTQVQTIDVAASPSRQDVVSFNVFDPYGREPKAFLPYTIKANGVYRSDPMKEQLEFYAGTPDVVRDKEPFHVNSFDESPLNRLSKSYAPGWNWHTDAESIPVTNAFDANTGDEVLLLRDLVGMSEYSATRFYPANSLTRSVTILENGLVQKGYKDIKDRLICEKKGNGSQWFETYYIYDVNGLLRFVFPPEATARLPEYAASQKKQSFLDRWVFQYRYDTNGRLTEKRVPGSDWVHMIYDQWDRLVLTQDGRQRPAKEWTFTKYDIHNRPIITGTTMGTRADLEDAASRSKIRYESRASNSIGYTNSAFPAHSETRLLTIKYYDCYNFIHYPDWDRDKLSYLPFDETGIVSKSEMINPGTALKVFDPVIRGYETGSKTRVLNSDEWLHKVVYYDRKYRPVQTIMKNGFQKRETISSALNAVTGNVEKRKRVHNGPTGATTIHEEFTYDHRDRLLQTWHQINNNPRTLLASMKYNELGQLVEKNVHSVNGSPFIQSIDFAYNIQGWLTGINRVTTDPETPDEAVSDLFGLEAMFETAPALPGNSVGRKYFDGRLSALSWRTEVPERNEVKIYSFDYDAFGRFRKSAFASRTATGWTGATGMFDEQVAYYDRNGNIGGGNASALIRNGMIDGLKKKIDDLTYKYIGNRLNNVKDHSLHAAGFSDKPGVRTSLAEFGYDSQGNLTSDQNKSITKITYNVLNLPQEIEFTRADLSPVRTDKIRFSYDADGNRLSREILVGGRIVWRTDYAGDFHYDNGEMSFVETSEGRAVPNGATFDYEYFFRDYQGNVRAVYGMVEQADCYKATMEPLLDNQERISYGFSNITETRSIGNNFTLSSPEVFSPAYSARCNGYATVATPVGPSKSLSVKAGDAIYAEVFARYNTVSTSPSNILATTLVSAVTTSFGVTNAENPRLYKSMNLALPTACSDVGQTLTAPKAYLVLLYFDRNYVFRRAAAHAVSERAYKQFEKLTISFTPEVNGYVYIYVINESNESALLDVYFDDLYIIHQKRARAPRILQSVDYYPFGLTYNVYQADRLRSVATGDGVRYEPVLRNRVLFQGQEHQNDLGLDWYQYRFRMHDPAIGRFGSVDPLAEDFMFNSPYAFCENKLAQGRELEGLEGTFYETLKYFSPVSFKINGSYTSHDSRIGVEVSLGIPKGLPFSIRKTFGISYVSRDYFGSGGTWETKNGTETSYGRILSFQSTTYKRGDLSQTTGMLTFGGPAMNAKYENDWWHESIMKELDPLRVHPTFGGDGGDRFRTAAFALTAGMSRVGFNLVTGDPGPFGKRSIERFGGIAGTYRGKMINGTVYDPDQYRLGLAYAGIGPFRIGINNESIRHQVQNRFAHDFLLKNDPSPWFNILPANDQLYFGLNNGSGTLWP